MEDEASKKRAREEEEEDEAAVSAKAQRLETALAQEAPGGDLSALPAEIWAAIAQDVLTTGAPDERRAIFQLARTNRYLGDVFAGRPLFSRIRRFYNEFKEHLAAWTALDPAPDRLMVSLQELKEAVFLDNRDFHVMGWELWRTFVAHEVAPELRVDALPRDMIDRLVEFTMGGPPSVATWQLVTRLRNAARVHDVPELHRNEFNQSLATWLLSISSYYDDQVTSTRLWRLWAERAPIDAIALNVATWYLTRPTFGSGLGPNLSRNLGIAEGLLWHHKLGLPWPAKRDVVGLPFLNAVSYRDKALVHDAPIDFFLNESHNTYFPLAVYWFSQGDDADNFSNHRQFAYRIVVRDPDANGKYTPRAWEQHVIQSTTPLERDDMAPREPTLRDMVILLRTRVLDLGYTLDDDWVSVLDAYLTQRGL